MKEQNIITILDSLGLYNIVTNNDWVNASCPYAPYSPAHKSSADNSPSFGVHIEEDGISLMNCFTCGKKGDLKKLARDMQFFHKKSYFPVLKMIDDAEQNKPLNFESGALRNRKRITELPEPIDEEWFNKNFVNVLNSKSAIQYLKARGITKRAVQKADLRWNSFEKRITFPIRHHDNKLYGYSGRSILKEEDYPIYENGKYPKIRDKLKKAHFILGIEHFTDKPIIVIEGLFSYIHLISIGADEYFDIACVFGATLTDQQASLLIQYQRSIYLMYDNDIAGDKALFGALDNNDEHKGGGAIDKLINHVPIYLPIWPKGAGGEEKDDIDQLNIDEVKEILDNTERYE